MRKEVKDFAMAMEEKMKKHDPAYGDSWKGCDLEFLFIRLNGEISEWEDAIDGFTEKTAITFIDDIESGRVTVDRTELLDIANVCMMLFHRLNVNAPSHSPIERVGDSRADKDGEAEAEHEVRKCPRCNVEIEDANPKLLKVLKLDGKWYWCEDCKTLYKDGEVTYPKGGYPCGYRVPASHPDILDDHLLARHGFRTAGGN